MGSRGINLGSDIDLVAYAAEDQIDAVLKKFCLTKNCKPDTALKWCLHRLTNEDDKAKIYRKLEEYYSQESGLL
jgi:hypothetical protein